MEQPKPPVEKVQKKTGKYIAVSDIKYGTPDGPKGGTLTKAGEHFSADEKTLKYLESEGIVKEEMK